MRKHTVALVCQLAICVAAHGTFAAELQPVKPLNLSAAASSAEHEGRMPLSVSSDGTWIAHTVEVGGHPLASMNAFFSKTGVSTADGTGRKRALLTSALTGNSIFLGEADASNWAPVWSPSGQQVAYYSDAGGRTRLWLWSARTRKAAALSNVDVHPLFGFELPIWSARGDEILCKLLPVPKSAGGGNAQLAEDTSGGGDAEKAIRVLVSPSKGVFAKFRDAYATVAADLGVFDARTGQVTRIALGRYIRWYELSPDGKAAFYAYVEGVQPNTNQTLFVIGEYDLVHNTARIIAHGIPMDYGNTVSVSPSGDRIAYIESGNVSSGQIHVVNLVNGTNETLKATGAAKFDLSKGEPYWSADGTGLYATSNDGDIWRFDPRRRAAVPVAHDADQALIALVPGPIRNTVLSSRSGALWVVGSERLGQKSGLFECALMDQSCKPVFASNGRILGTYNLATSMSSNDIVFVMGDHAHPDELFQYSLRTNATHEVGGIAAGVEPSQIGDVKTVEWTEGGGKMLGAALLLPPRYKKGQRLPLVVWAYSGMFASQFTEKYGLWLDPEFNMQVLATRGYAVLAPDLPFRTGDVVADTAREVDEAVDAAIDQGYADCEHLAIMGQSFGSFSTLAVITHTTRYKAAVITGAVLHPDVISQYLIMGANGSPNDVGYIEKGQMNLGEDLWSNPARYLDNSPIFSFNKIQTPLLIGQGADDRTVGRDGATSDDSLLLPSNAIFVALQRLGKYVEYRIYKGEGHVLQRPSNIIDFWNARLRFLASNMHLRVDADGRVSIPAGAAGSCRLRH